MILEMISDWKSRFLLQLPDSFKMVNLVYMDTNLFEGENYLMSLLIMFIIILITAL